MSFAFFGRIRIRHIEPAVLSLVQRWMGDRRSIWEQRLDWLKNLLNEPDEKAEGYPTKTEGASILI
jgi:hypothetical protein